MSKPSKKTLLIAFLTIFLDLLGFGIIIPIQPAYVESFGVTPKIVTLLGASYSIMQFLFAPFWGTLSDKIGRRPIILFSILISAVGHFLFAWAASLPLLFAARMLAGFGNANIGTAQAIIADVTSAENRSKGMALIGVAFGLGFLLGPALGGFLVRYSTQTPFIVAGMLSLLNLAFAFFMLEETKSKDSVPQERKLFDPSLFRDAKQFVNVREILLISLIYTTAFALMEQAISLYIERVWVMDLNLPSDEHIEKTGLLTAYFLIVVGITAIVVQGGMIGKLTKRFGEAKLISIGLVAIFLSMLSIPLLGGTKNYTLFLLTAVIMAFGTGVLNPSKSALLSRSIPDNQQGSFLGLNQSFAAIGRFIGPLFSGILFEFVIDAPFYGAAILLIFALFLARPLQQPSLT